MIVYLTPKELLDFKRAYDRSTRSAKRQWVLERGRIHGQVHKAVREGRLQKPPACEWCNSPHRISGHHRDYSKPLEVIWLCPLCHRKDHVAINQGKGHWWVKGLDFETWMRGRGYRRCELSRYEKYLIISEACSE
jgi:hypothetical protein